jgi:hypothetical protein
MTKGNTAVDRREQLREWAPVFRENFELAPELPSGLKWKTNRGKAVIGGRAGTRYPDGYWKVSCRGKFFPTGHVVLVLNGIYPEADTPEVDHIDRKQDNNCVSNLRWVNRKDNNNNRGTLKPGEPRYCTQKEDGTWVSYYKVEVPGSYPTEELAYYAALAHRLETQWNY